MNSSEGRDFNDQARQGHVRETNLSPIFYPRPWGSYVLNVGTYTGTAAVREQSSVPVFMGALDT